ncbi:unnamed protein product [Blepharisma stoltei]|uniref:Uncharacterized protein n=1 Tax=Blepharisma stoltei TaxID=1481888 RepID=A0AAU9JL95_9CILI|nr:unnamed protein product [Blepharisma stoltei]
MKKVHVFFICAKRVKKVLIKFLTVQILDEKSTKGKKNRGKKYIDFLYENTNFLNMFTLKMRRTHQFNFAAYINSHSTPFKLEQIYVKFPPFLIN